MLADILVTSNFPDVISSNVEYSVSFQLLMDERRDSKLVYKFSNEAAVKRVSKREEQGSFFYDDVSLSFVMSEAGIYTFYLLLGSITIYEKTFIVEDVFSVDEYINRKIEPLCFQRPSNVILRKEGTCFDFKCFDASYETWTKYYFNHDIKHNKKIYCGIRYFAPERSTHWRIVTKGVHGTQDSGFVEFTNSDGCMVDWYFPIAEIEKDSVGVYERVYEQSIGFYALFGNEYIELDYEEYSININRAKIEKIVNTNIWNEEILRLIYFIREGYQTKDLIRKYGAWHSLSEDEIVSDIRRFKDNFGEFALQKGLIETENQATLLNYATHYTLIDAIVKLGITDLRQNREDFQELMLLAKKGIREVLPQIK